MADFYDVIVIGAGPAGLSAAIYTARAKYRVLVLEKGQLGGQITITSEIVNYPGVERTDGKQLTEAMRKQAEAFGAEFRIAEVKSFDLAGEYKTVSTQKEDIKTLSIILALGANPRKLGFPGEQEFGGRGIAYCATCDGEFFTGLDVFVIGGGFAAAEEAVFLTKYARKVTMIIREPDFTCAKTVADQARGHEKIEVLYHTEITEAGGEGRLQYAVFKNNETGEEWRYEADPGNTFGIFVFAGYVPATGWIKSVDLDQHGYIITDMDQKTNIDGVYGAGDVCVKNLRQVVTAVSDGAVAATSAEHYVTNLYDKLKLPKREISRSEASSFGKQENHAFQETSFFITTQMKEQLTGVFEKFENPVLVKASLDDSKLASEMEQFIDELSGISEKVLCRKERRSQEQETDLKKPVLSICDAKGNDTGIRFYMVPGGHEFNSFVIALYNVAGPGQSLDEADKSRIQNIDRPCTIKVVVSLSCTMCPTTVMSAQRIASLSPYVNAWVYDLAHNPDLKEQYQIMSVPCMIINDTEVTFGKKTVDELLKLL